MKVSKLLVRASLPLVGVSQLLAGVDVERVPRASFKRHQYNAHMNARAHEPQPQFVQLARIRSTDLESALTRTHASGSVIYLR